MQRSQLELWSAEPHPTPPIYQQLTPAQRNSLVADYDETGHLFRSIPDSVPRISDSYRSEATLWVLS